MLVFQSTSFAEVLPNIKAKSDRIKNASHMKRTVFLAPPSDATAIAFKVKTKRIDPLVTLFLNDLKSTKKGLRVGKGKDAEIIPWRDVSHIPDCVGRVLDAGGKVFGSTITIKAKTAAELRLL